MTLIRNKPPKLRSSANEGTALVASLWLSLILALLAVSVISIARKTVLENKVQMRLETAWTLAEGGIAIASYHIAGARDPWRPREAAYTAELGDVDIAIYVRSPQSKIDLNGASSFLLSSLFLELGYSQERANKYGDAIADWRDEDGLTRLNGAEARAYRVAGRKNGPNNAPFTDISQLQNVLGIDANIYACARPFVTLYAPSGRVDPYLARGPVRRAAGLGETPPPSLPSVRRASIAGQVFEVQALAPISDKSAARVTAIIRFTGNPADPVWRHLVVRDVIPYGDEPIDSERPPTCPKLEVP